MHQDEQHGNQQGIGSHLHPISLRPKSLAVPGMTSSSFSPSMLLSFLQEPQVRIKSLQLRYKYGFEMYELRFFKVPHSTFFLDFFSYWTRGVDAHVSLLLSIEKRGRGISEMSLPFVTSQRATFQIRMF